MFSRRFWGPCEVCVSPPAGDVELALNWPQLSVCACLMATPAENPEYDKLSFFYFDFCLKSALFPHNPDLRLLLNERVKDLAATTSPCERARPFICMLRTSARREPESHTHKKKQQVFTEPDAQLHRHHRATDRRREEEDPETGGLLHARRRNQCLKG